MTLDYFRAEWPLVRSQFELAKDLYNAVSAEQDGVLTGPTYEEILELVGRYLDERVRAVGSAMKQDIGVYYWRERAFNILETAIREAPTDMTTVPLFGEPRYLSTTAVAPFKWPAIAAEGKKTHFTKVPCHVDLEAQVARFLDEADDVVKYVKNERLGFSITYHDQGRPRQYYPDFAVLVRGEDGQHTWWLVEPKGEIRPNTNVKSEAARLWCERMTRAGQGRWRYLFAQQRKFEKAVGHGVRTFAELVAELEGAGGKHLTLVPPDSEAVPAIAYKSHLPVYSLEAAAGYFGEGRAVELEGWAEAPTALGKLDERMFVARIVGHSMEPLLNDGDCAVFRANPAGTRQGKVVLAMGPIEDPEIGGPYTVKKYFSEKAASEDGEWRHARVRLVPENPEYEEIVVEAEGDEVSVVAEYVDKM